MRISIIFALLLLSSCGSTMFTTDRTFVDEMDKDTDGFFVPERDFPVMAGDTGQAARTKREIMERTPLEGKEKYDLKRDLVLDEELKELEDSLTDPEFNHYAQYRDRLPTISDRIYLLKLKNIRERNRYLASRGIKIRGEKIAVGDDTFAVRSREIYLGMSKDSVVKSWGRPVRVDVAGNPQNQNERWMFYDGGKAKYVFFEYGQVRGWELDSE